MGRNLGLGRAVMAVGSMLPGFLFPFVLSQSLSEESSDLFLLASSIALTIAGVVGSAIEVNTVVQVGRILARGDILTNTQLRLYRKRQLLLSIGVAIVLGFALTIIYGLRSYQGELSSFIPVALICATVPIIGSAASVRSGELIARERPTAPILLQSARSVPPLFVVLLWPSTSLVVLAALLCVGECGRLLILFLLLRRERLPSRGNEETELEYKGTVSQALSSGTSQAGPVTDRFFLGTSQGAITAYEISEKLFYAAFQFLNLTVVVRRVSSWARIRSMDVSDAKSMLRRDFIKLLVLCTAIAGMSVILLLVVDRSGLVATQWQQGLKWACIGLGALPFGIGSFVVSRLLVISGRQRMLIWLAGVVTVANVGANMMLFLLMGPIGVPIGTALVRGSAFVVYLIVACRVIPPILGSDLTLDDDVKSSR